MLAIAPNLRQLPLSVAEVRTAAPTRTTGLPAAPDWTDVAPIPRDG